MQTSCALGGGGDLKAFLRKWHVNLCVEGKKKKEKNGSLSKQTEKWLKKGSHIVWIQKLGRIVFGMLWVVCWAWSRESWGQDSSREGEEAGRGWITLDLHLPSGLGIDDCPEVFISILVECPCIPACLWSFSYNPLIFLVGSPQSMKAFRSANWLLLLGTHLCILVPRHLLLGWREENMLPMAQISQIRRLIYSSLSLRNSAKGMCWDVPQYIYRKS